MSARRACVFFPHRCSDAAVGTAFRRRCGSQNDIFTRQARFVGSATQRVTQRGDAAGVTHGCRLVVADLV